MLTKAYKNRHLISFYVCLPCSGRIGRKRWVRRTRWVQRWVSAPPVGTNLITDLLTEARTRRAKPKARPYKLRDGGGLFLLITPGDARQWRLRYKVRGRESMLALGTYPAASLKAARAWRAEMRAALEAGKNPAAERRAERENRANTFETIAREWLAKHVCTEDNGQGCVDLRGSALSLYRVATRHFSGSTGAPRGLSTTRAARQARDGTPEQAAGRSGPALRDCDRSGRARSHGGSSWRTGAIQVTNRAAVTDPREVAQLLRALAGYQGHPIVEAALKMAPLVFVRPGELRAAEWAEINLDGAEWRIAPYRTKMRRPHLVPLAKQTVAILRESSRSQAAAGMCFHHRVPRCGR